MKYSLKNSLIVLGLFCIPSVVFGYTVVSSDIEVDTVWNKVGNPYVVEGEVSVFYGKVLTLNPGVIVKFKSGSSFFVDGSLKVLGIENEKVYLTSFSNDSVGGDSNSDGLLTNASSEYDWNVVVNGLYSEIHHADISFSEGLTIGKFTPISNTNISYTFTNPAISVYGGLALEQVTLDTGESHGVLFGNFSKTLSVASSTISGFSGNGIRVVDGGFLIQNSIIKNNSIGIFVEEPYVPILIKIRNIFIPNVYAGLVKTIQNSSLFGNTEYAILNDSSDTIFAENNWWGDSSGPNHLSNPQGNGGEVSDRVIFSNSL